NDAQWQKLCEVLQRTDLAEEARFKTNPRRVQHREQLIVLLQEIFENEDIAFWLDAIAPAGIPCGPLQTLDQVFTDPQLLGRDMVWTVAHPTAGEVQLVGSPLKLSETPVAGRTHPPLLGEHTDEVLTVVLGYSAEQVTQLREQGVV